MDGCREILESIAFDPAAWELDDADEPIDDLWLGDSIDDEDKDAIRCPSCDRDGLRLISETAKPSRLGEFGDHGRSIQVLADHAEHAEGLLAFFTKFDEEQTNTARKVASPPTRNAIASNRSRQTAKEVGDITHEAHGVSRPQSQVGGLASDGLSGIGIASILAGAFIGFTIAE